MKKVLVIDDELDFCLLIQQFLKRREFEVELAHTLMMGIQKIKEYKPDIIFLDNNLPDGIGWEKVAFILDALPDVRVYLISAFKNAREAMASEKVTVIEKPISFTTLEKYL